MPVSAPAAAAADDDAAVEDSNSNWQLERSPTTSNIVCSILGVAAAAAATVVDANANAYEMGSVPAQANQSTQATQPLSNSPAVYYFQNI